MSEVLTEIELDAMSTGDKVVDEDNYVWIKRENGLWSVEDVEGLVESENVALYDPRPLAETEQPMSITEEREADYGDAQTSFSRIAEFWTTYLQGRFVGVSITPKDVAAMMILLKVSRSVTSPDKDDTWIDISGYAELGKDVE